MLKQASRHRWIVEVPMLACKAHTNTCNIYCPWISRDLWGSSSFFFLCCLQMRLHPENQTSQHCAALDENLRHVRSKFNVLWLPDQLLRLPCQTIQTQLSLETSTKWFRNIISSHKIPVSGIILLQQQPVGILLPLSQLNQQGEITI